MPVHFLGADLSRWDASTAEALVLSFFADERPLRGAAGLADWRLCGRLSRLIERERVSGRRGETLMLPPGRRLPFTRVLLFGLGDAKNFGEDTFRQHVRWIRDVTARAGAKHYAIQPPGRSRGLIGARRALELWMDESEKDGHPAEVVIIDSPDAHKDMAELLRYQGRKG
jgi:hypothetical protein